jgi:hypothetical protein
VRDNAQANTSRFGVSRQHRRRDREQRAPDRSGG